MAVTDRGVCEIHDDADPDAEAERLARIFGTRVLRSPRPTDQVHRQLDEYFAGERQSSSSTSTSARLVSSAVPCSSSWRACPTAS